jgi:signal transduction histidine kinase
MSSTMRGLWGWDAAVVATCGAAATIILVLGRGSHASWEATAGLALVLVVYVAIGRRALVAPKGTTASRWATALLISAGVVGTWFDPFAATSQAVLYPLLWVLSSGRPSAIIRSAVLAIGMALATGLGTGDWISASVDAVLAFAFTLALGLWITRIQRYGAERDQLLTELRAAQDEVAALERQAGITEERARVAREIHDTIAQSLTGLVMTAQRASTIAARAPESLEPTLALMENLAIEALAEARALVASYTPVNVSGGLPATLAALADRFSAETGVTVIVSGEAPDVDREAEVVLLRCAQEALANVRKHAHARQVRVSIDATDDGAGLTVTDDGVGIGAQAGNGYGLAGMAERVRLVGGTVEVGPDVSGGTTVRVALPRRSGAEVVS